jgi:hypothetical protein
VAVDDVKIDMLRDKDNTEVHIKFHTVILMK